MPGIVQLQARPSPVLFVPASDSDVSAWVAAVESAGSSVSADTAAAASRAAISAKSAGLWSKILVWDLCAGDDLTASLVRLKVPGGVSRSMTNVNFVAGDYTERGASGGLKGNGSTKHLNTGLNPVTLAWSLTSLMLWVYQREAPPAGTTMVNLGVATFDSGNITASGWFAVGTRQSCGIGAATSPGEIPTGGAASVGMTGGGTNGDRSQQPYINGLPSGSAVVATGVLADGTIGKHVQRRSGAAPVLYSNLSLSQSLITTGLTAAEVATLNTIVQAFEAALGRSV